MFDRPTALENPTQSKEKDSSPHLNEILPGLICDVCCQTSFPQYHSYPSETGEVGFKDVF